MITDLCVICDQPLPPVEMWSGPACPACTASAEHQHCSHYHQDEYLPRKCCACGAENSAPTSDARQSSDSADEGQS